jgi:sulfite reductase subunit B
MTENIYTPCEARIEGIVDETPNIKTFVFTPKKPIGFQAGQFVEVTVPGVGEAPFTPSSSPDVKEKIEVTIMNVGTVTSALHSMSKGDVIGIRGPYGGGYPLEQFKGKEILIVGGGVGLAPLRSLFLALVSKMDLWKGITFCYGAKTPKDMVYKGTVREWSKLKNVNLKLTVDSADATWTGKVGLVTKLLDDLNGLDISNSVAIVCGPPVMMKFATFKLLDIGYPGRNIFLSMEKNMSCGVGKCGHCQLGRYYVCKDGPVLTYDAIKNLPNVWE